MFSVALATITFMAYSLSIAFLHIIIPATELDGYVCNEVTGKPMQYRLNGIRVWIAVVGIFTASKYVFISRRLYIDITLSFRDNIWYYVLISSFFGILFSILGYSNSGHLILRTRAVTVDQVKGHDTKCIETKLKRKDSGIGLFLYHFYSGIEFNPRWTWLPLFDFKLFLYIYGAISVQLIVLLAAQAQCLVHGRITTAMGLYGAMMSYFVIDYLYHEDVHLYTYDMFAEKLGFKLIWGCICFYPFFYTVGIWSLIDSEPPVLVILTLLLFVTGSVLSRGANNQKYYAKTKPTEKFMGIEQRVIPGTRLIYSGWWGLARHINYTGEILMSIALAIPGLCAGSFVPLLYPLYYILLLVPRERMDNRICQEKYGEAWEEYCEKVPYRMVPFIY